MREHPDTWFSAASPDARIKARPALSFLLARARPDDRLIGLPYPGPYYFYAARPASRYTLMLHPKAGYNSEAEYRALWDEITRERPRFVVVTPGGGEASLEEYVRYPLPGYREVAREGVFDEQDANRALIFERAR